MQDILSMKQGLNDKRLVDICGIQYGCPFDASLFSTSPSEGMPLIRIRDVKGGQTETYYSGEYCPEFIIRKGDYLIGMDGEFNIAPWQSEDALLNQRVCKIYTKSQDVVIRYVYRFLQKELKKIEDETPFVTVKHLSAKRLNQVYLPVPPIAEQEKIVAELDCLSGIIEKKRQQLKELDNLSQSIFYEMFGDPVENDKGWDIYALSKNVKVKGRVGWKGYKKDDLRDSGPLAIGGGHLTDSGGVDISSPVFLSMEKYLESPEIMIEVGDIILVQRGTIGKVGLIANDIGMATINPCVLILRPENLNSIYLLHYFLSESIQTHLKTLIKGVAQPMITQQQVNGLLLPMPPLYLQQDFASKIETIEKQKELIAQSIKETETLFNSRMDYYFN